MRVLNVLLLVSAIALTASVAYATDIDFGSTARSVGMGGAGLALGDELATTAVVNPAAPAVSGSGFRLILPGVGVHTTGASVGELIDRASNISNGDATGALNLANDFAKQPTSLSMTTVVGFAGTFGLTFQGEAKGLVTPSAAASEWANASQLFQTGNVNVNTLYAAITNTNFRNIIDDPTNADAHLTTYLGQLSQNFVGVQVAYGPSVAFSHSYNTNRGKVYMGTNWTLLQTESQRWQIDATSPGVTVTGGVTTAPITFNATELSPVKSNSLKVDVGTIYKPNGSPMQYGMVINNFIKPDLNGINPARSERMISVGMAMPLKHMIVAADLININKANGENTQLRFGGEMSLGPWFALRAGYAGSSWTYGMKVLGINLAFAGKTAQLLSNILKF